MKNRLDMSPIERKRDRERKVTIVELESDIKLLKLCRAERMKKIKELETKLKIAEEALEFYANEADIFDGFQYSDDYSKVDILENTSAEVLGKRAREALNAIKEL